MGWLGSRDVTTEAPVNCQQPDVSITDRAEMTESVEGLIKIAALLQNRHFIVSHPSAGIYPVSYLAALLRFFAGNTQHYYVDRMAPTGLFTQWLQGRLPVAFNPQIEITVEQMFNLLEEAARVDPLQTLRGEPTEVLHRFHGEFLAMQSQQVLGISNQPHA